MAREKEEGEGDRIAGAAVALRLGPEDHDGTRAAPAFSWRKGAVHALAGFLFAPLSYFLFVFLGVASLSNLGARAAGQVGSYIALLTLLISYLFQSGRRIAAWVVTSSVLALFGFGVVKAIISQIDGTDPPLIPSVVAGKSTSGGPWDYHSEQHGFSLRLPSGRWLQAQEGTHLVDFWTNTTGVVMMAGVLALQPITRPEEFQASLDEFRATTKNQANLLTTPAFEEGRTEKGHRYIFTSFSQKSKDHDIYVAAARIWLETRGVTITVIFEGHGAYSSKLAKSIEHQTFEENARSICLSAT